MHYDVAVRQAVCISAHCLAYYPGRSVQICTRVAPGLHLLSMHNIPSSQFPVPWCYVTTHCRAIPNEWPAVPVPNQGGARVSGEALTVALSKSMHADLVKTIPVCENADASRCRGLVLRISGLSKTAVCESDIVYGGEAGQHGYIVACHAFNGCFALAN